MVFSSLEFVCIFLPVFFTVYYLISPKLRNPVLLCGSLCFYAIGTLHYPLHFVIFILSIVTDYFMGLLMDRFPEKKKLFLITGILFHIACLGYFKYSGFLSAELGRWLPALHLPTNPVLPIGISFYTFQGISYLADVYRQTVRAEKNPLRFAVYIAMFEQLIAGPIVTFPQIQDRLKKRVIRKEAVLSGLGTFIFGLGLKVLLANPIGRLWTQIGSIGYESISTPLAWMGIAAFSIQIYLDFFGYSLMAVGLGRMMGFALPANFRHPYTSISMTDFWRCWHMTLGSWFRNYVYIPLGGNKCSRFRWIMNLLIVWALTGIWHGAGYNFLLWGISLFVILLAEKTLYGKALQRYPWMGHLYMLLLIPLTWAVFSISDIQQLGIFFTRLFPFFGTGPWSVFRYDYLKYLIEYYPFFLIGIVFCTRLPYRLLGQISKSRILYGILAGVLAACIYCMARGLDDPFLYYRF